MNKVADYLKLISFLLISTSVTIFFYGCSQEVTLQSQKDKLANRAVTQVGQEIIYPDASPSIADGQAVYKRLECATCHGADGKPIGGKATLNFTNKTWERKQKPNDLFEFIYFGKPGIVHTTVRQTVTNRDAWNLVFYVRSLAQPLLDEKTLADVDAVFGSNCAVCHGKKGYGDGPLSKNLEPMPANFQNKARFYDRSDDDLWDHIANGIKWEGMPNFLGKEDKAKNVKFDTDYIWKLVQYVRHFHEAAESSYAAPVKL